MLSFVCVRHHRIKSFDWGSTSPTGEGFGAVGRWSHYARLIPTKNADPKRFDEICIATAATKWIPEPLSKSRFRGQFQTKTFLADRIKERLSVLGITRWRSDAVLAEELHLSISPEFLRDGDERNPQNRHKVTLARRAKLAFLRKKYGDNLIAFIDHPDETNYHAAAWVVPAMLQVAKQRGRPKKSATAKEAGKGAPATKRWTLCAKKLFSRNELSKNQEQFAKDCREHGLDVRRGVLGSRTAHTEMRAHLSLVNQPTEPVKFIEVPPPGGFLETKAAYAERLRSELEQQVEGANSQLTRFYAKSLEFDREVDARKSYQMAASDAGMRAENLSAKVDQLEKENAALKEAARANADRIRDISLERVAHALGYIPDAATPGVFNSPMGELIVGDKKFTFTGKGLSGRNAIDLVKAATNSDFAASVRWLVTAFPSEANAALANNALHNCEKQFQQAVQAGPLSMKDQAAIFAPPEPANWPALRQKLEPVLGEAIAMADEAQKCGLFAATKTGMLAVTLTRPEKKSQSSGFALYDPQTMAPRQIVGTGAAILRPSSLNDSVTFAEDLSEGLMLAHLQPTRKNVIIPMRRELSEDFWLWARKHITRIDIAGSRVVLGWIVEQAETVFEQSGQMFDGLMEGLFR